MEEWRELSTLAIYSLVVSCVVPHKLHFCQVCQTTLLVRKSGYADDWHLFKAMITAVLMLTCLWPLQKRDIHNDVSAERHGQFYQQEQPYWTGCPHSLHTCIEIYVNGFTALGTVLLACHLFVREQKYTFGKDLD